MTESHAHITLLPHEAVSQAIATSMLQDYGERLLDVVPPEHHHLLEVTVASAVFAGIEFQEAQQHMEAMDQRIDPPGMQYMRGVLDGLDIRTQEEM